MCAYYMIVNIFFLFLLLKELLLLVLVWLLLFFNLIQDGRKNKSIKSVSLIYKESIIV